MEIEARIENKCEGSNTAWLVIKSRDVNQIGDMDDIWIGLQDKQGLVFANMAANSNELISSIERCAHAGPRYARIGRGGEF